MKSILLVCSLLIGTALAWPLRHDDRYLHRDVSQSNVVQELWIDQLIDHFDSNNHATFKQKYVLNDQYWQNNATFTGPMLLSISGEGPLGSGAIDVGSGTAYYGAQIGALLVSLEHRFYGSSLPFGNNVSTEALHFLSSRQALADLAYFIDALRSNGTIKSDTPVISIGGSYAGAMSAWLKQQYPSHLIGAHSSSGPVHAEQDFFAYLDIVADGLGEQCTSIVQNASVMIDEMLLTSQGRSHLSRFFNTCSPIETDQDAGLFTQNLLGPLTALVQYNTNYRPINITSACQYLNDQLVNATAMDALYSFNLYYNYMPMPDSQTGCMEVNYTKYITEDMQAAGADRSWTYQCCNEFGWWQTSEDNKQPFSQKWNDLAWQQGQCVDIFNKTFNTSDLVDETNAFYGGRTIKADNLFMANGIIDPWHHQSIYSSNSGQLIGKNVQYKLIGPTSHCQDIGAPHPTDIPELTAVRQQIVESMKQWLSGAADNDDSDDTVWIITVCVIGGLAVCMLLVCVGWRMKQTAAHKTSNTSEQDSMYSHLNA